MNRLTVGILGSCATRDNFNSLFNETYQEKYECTIFQMQSSVISVMSEPVRYNENKIDNLKHEYYKKDIEAEFKKDILDRLVEKNPDILILDFFADVYFGVFKLGNSFVTHNTWKLPATTFYKELGSIEKINGIDHKQQFLQIWKESANRLMEFLMNLLPNAKIILNKARFVDFYIDGEEVKRLSESGRMYSVDVDKYNNLWNTLDDHILSRYHIDSIPFPDSQFADFHHPWGPFYVHYTKKYYRSFFENLQVINS
ncbi:DUF6270 domain-containing protein [Mesobacillus zeae]|uniref:Uncharacterized protein n=1 Tax=Mesobacillus zeae TaxID=1917180 RepID=A0A398BD32_9BACI|nr:DUF6270 domain-containing protein [Mesobacillus zeae]RID85680.1 hypothetical protein D1970_08990 [Mesobacillus zeae]